MRSEAIKNPRPVASNHFPMETAMSEPILDTWRRQGPGEAKELPSAGKALIGWGGVLVWDPAVNPVDLARAFAAKTRDESCGQCFPCRLGSQRIAAILERICAGRGEPRDLARLGELATRVAQTARCDIGQTLGKPLRDLLAARADAFAAAVAEKKPIPRGEYESWVTAPCMNACPSHVNIPGYLEKIRFEQPAEGLALVRRDCMMPGTIGRVCVRPCEANCRRARLDEPLSIKGLKRYLADYELASGAAPELPAAPPRPEKVAVVGAGPAGLACAFYLGQKGYRTTVFEAQEGPGGMAAYGIPAYRLPRDVLAYEASLIERVGGEFRYGVGIGKDLTLQDLSRQGYAAVFLAVGAPEASPMRCEGEDAGYQCFMTGVEFLAKAARGQRPLEGDRLLVIGGGNVAMDCVRTGRRLGFNDVNLLYRRTEAEMPADPMEIEEAKEEGVKFHYLVAPLSIVAEEGRVTGLKCQRMALGEPDQSGRRRPVPVEGSEFVIACDAIIPAVGQVCVVDCVLPDSAAVTRWKTLVVNQTTFQTEDPRLFGGGDCVTGPATLIAALAAGKHGARFIDHYLQTGACAPGPLDHLAKLVRTLGVYDPEEAFPQPGLGRRPHPPTLTPEERVKSFAEVEGGFDPVAARREAGRCLRCYRIAVAAL